MFKAEQIARMKEQMRPSAELISQVREQVATVSAAKPAWHSWGLRGAAILAAAVVISVATWWGLPQLGQSEQQQTGESPMLGAAGTFSISGNSQSDDDTAGGQRGAGPIQNGVYIPAMELEEPEAGTLVDMIGLIVYRGNIYTFSNELTLTKEQETALRGEYLGRTKGNIDEWSQQDDYAQEFASSIGVADVYAVNGYDRDFRIMTSDGEGKVGVYEHLNGIWLETGEDLFGKMGIRGNLQTLSWQPLEEWDSGEENRYAVRLSSETADLFIDGLYNSVYLEQPDWRNLKPKPCYLTLHDGTEIRLMLLQGGYVKYMGMGGDGVFQMEASAFEKVYDALA